MSKLTSLVLDTVNVVIFDANKYPNAQADFAKAVEAGDVDILEVDEDSYTMFYNIQNSVEGAATLLGQKIHLGTCKNDVFVSIDEMDGYASENDEQWGDRTSGFEAGLAYRASLKAKQGEAVCQ